MTTTIQNDVYGSVSSEDTTVLHTESSSQRESEKAFNLRVKGSQAKFNLKYKKANALPASQQTLLQWHNLSYYVPASKSDLQNANGKITPIEQAAACVEKTGLPETAFFQKDKQVVKQVVANSFGCVKPGETVAIMGPSGSGKTSLLKMLSQRIKTTGGAFKQGTVMINQTPITKERDFGEKGAFVQQDNVLIDTLTPQELFRFACQIRLGLTGKQLENRVNEVLDYMSLQECKDTIFGGWLIKGLSTGEQKRTSIGYEFITNPSLLLMDEPTSGLDSNTAHQVIQIIKQRAQERRMAVLCTIHQPSSEILFSFDRIILLSEGYTIYDGPPKQVEQFFGQWGFKLPKYANPADKLLNIACMPRYELKINSPSVLELAQATKTKTLEFMKEAETQQLKESDPSDLQLEDSGRAKVSWWKQFCFLNQRRVSVVTRTPVLITFLVILACMNTGQYCNLYYKVADFEFGFNQAKNQQNVWNLLGFSFLQIQDMFVNMMFAMIVTIPIEFPMLRREASSGMYSISAYYLSLVLVGTLTFIWYPIILSLLSIWWFGFPIMGLSGFLHYAGILTITALVGSQFGFMLGCLIPDMDTVQIIGQLFITYFAIGGGFQQNLANPNIWISFLSWVSPFHYGTELMFRRVLMSRLQVVQNQIYDTLGYNYSDQTCVQVLVGMWIGFMLFGLVTLHIYLRK